MRALVMILALGLLVAACGEDEEPARPPAPETELTVTIRPVGPGGERRTRTITCRPQARHVPCPGLEDTTVPPAPRPGERVRALTVTRMTGAPAEAWRRATPDPVTVVSDTARVQRLEVSAFEIPTEEPESDGTLSWDSTTLVVVEARAGGETGLGYTYGHRAIAEIVAGDLADAVEGLDALAPPQAWSAMTRMVRNSVRAGLCAYAVSAVDIALHDLKARLLGVSLADLLGRRHDGIAIYGSGGFTSYSLDRLREQARGWREAGIDRVKVKVGRDPAADGDRLRAVREVVGDDTRLMVDANGASTPQAAIAAAHETYAPAGVTWLEEPVSSDDHEGLRRVRECAPPGMEVAAGEYGTDVFHFRRLLGAVDVLQPDVTRCGGVTGVLHADALALSHCAPISAHCAPAVSAHVFAACETAVHLEYFHDHVRIESMLFDGTLSPEGGRLVPDAARPGLGIDFKWADAERYRS